MIAMHINYLIVLAPCTGQDTTSNAQIIRADIYAMQWDAKSSRMLYDPLEFSEIVLQGIKDGLLERFEHVIITDSVQLSRYAVLVQKTVIICSDTTSSAPHDYRLLVVLSYDNHINLTFGMSRLNHEWLADINGFACPINVILLETVESDLNNLRMKRMIREHLNTAPAIAPPRCR